MAHGTLVHPPIVIIGGGTMARAIVEGAAGAGALETGLTGLVEPVAERRAGFRSRVGALHAGAAEGAAWLAQTEKSPGEGQVLLAVKPQALLQVADELRPALGRIPRIVISIMAGIPSGRIREALGGHVRVVRVMPNTAARIGRGMTAIAGGAGSVPGDAGFAERVFGALGEVVTISEAMMDPFTALAGSGPAYVFYLAEALVLAALDMGFDRGAAVEIVRRTVAGAGLLLADSSDEPGALRQAVTSKGGTTAAASEVLDSAGVGQIVRRAVLAARDRGAELGRV